MKNSFPDFVCKECVPCFDLAGSQFDQNSADQIFCSPAGSFPGLTDGKLAADCTVEEPAPGSRGP